MTIMDFSSDITFNAIFSIYVYLAVMIAPIFAAYGLFTGK